MWHEGVLFNAFVCDTNGRLTFGSPFSDMALSHWMTLSVCLKWRPVACKREKPKVRTQQDLKPTLVHTDNRSYKLRPTLNKQLQVTVQSKETHMKHSVGKDHNDLTVAFCGQTLCRTVASKRVWFENLIDTYKVIKLLIRVKKMVEIAEKRQRCLISPVSPLDASCLFILLDLLWFDRIPAVPVL